MPRTRAVGSSGTTAARDCSVTDTGLELVDAVRCRSRSGPGYE